MMAANPDPIVAERNTSQCLTIAKAKVHTSSLNRLDMVRYGLTMPRKRQSAYQGTHLP
jgi:hypothetical protein